MLSIYCFSACKSLRFFRPFSYNQWALLQIANHKKSYRFCPNSVQFGKNASFHSLLFYSNCISRFSPCTGALPRPAARAVFFSALPMWILKTVRKARPLFGAKTRLSFPSKSKTLFRYSGAKLRHIRAAFFPLKTRVLPLIKSFPFSISDYFFLNIF